MLGFRGAARYAHPAYAEGFALECRAMKRVRDEMGLANVKLMIPFCRRVEEAERVLEAMAAHGLQRGVNGLEIYVMCEIPNNVIQIDAFAKLFDGFSIGSNDLTQLVLGVDRDSDIVAFDFDERDAGVLELIRQADRGRAAQRPPRRHLRPGAVRLSGHGAHSWSSSGIDSISLNPDSIIRTIRACWKWSARSHRQRTPLNAGRAMRRRNDDQARSRYQTGGGDAPGLNARDPRRRAGGRAARLGVLRHPRRLQRPAVARPLRRRAVLR